MKKIFPLFLFSLFTWAVNVQFARSQNQPLKWQKLSNGIWKAEAGSPENLNLLTAAGTQPKTDAINAMKPVEFPLDENELRAEISDGKTYLRFPLAEGEKIFGLGLNFKTVEQRGRILRLHVDHYGGVDNGRTHAPVPFYVSSKGYGIFINSARYLDIWVGTGVRKESKNPPVVRDRNTDKKWSSKPYSDNVEVLVPAEGVEIYLFGGPTAAGELIFKPTRESMEKHLLPIFKNKIKILPSKLKPGDAAIVGASALVWKELEKI